MGLYLGHAPRGMDQVYYAAPDRGGFDAAIGWLGSEFSPQGRFAR